MNNSKIAIMRNVISGKEVAWPFTRYIGILRKMRIFLDGKEIGSIKNKETKTIEVSPGDHFLYLKVDFSRTEKIYFNVEEHQNIHFQAGFVKNPIKLMLTIIYYFIPNGFIFLKLINGEDIVMKEWGQPLTG